MAVGSGRAIGLALVLAGCGAACSSTVRDPAARALPSPKAIAAAYVDRLVGLPILPPGARPVKNLPSMVTAISRIGGVNQFVVADRVWHVDLPQSEVIAFLAGSPPHGTNTDQSETASDGAGRVAKGVEYNAITRPSQPEIGETSLQASVADDGPRMSWVQVEAEATWRARRPDDEHVARVDKVLVISEYTERTRNKVLRHRVVADGHVVAPIVAAFNSLPVQIPASSACPADFGDSPSYKVAFTRSPTAPPDVVATISTACGGGTAVTVHGRPSLGLERGDLPTLLDAALG